MNKQLEKYLFYILFTVIILLLTVKGFTWEVSKHPYKAIYSGSKITYTGKLGQTFKDSIEYKGGYYRTFPSYCPAIHRRPRSWGKIKK